MFTGIITNIGVAKFITNTKLAIDINKSFWNDVKDGDSISVNGVCLTIVMTDSETYFNLSSETLNITSINTINYKIGEIFNVNIEKSIRSGDYLGGHIIYCHVHTTGEIFKEIDENGNLWVVINEDCSEKIRYKGSIAIDGISLTIAEIKYEFNKTLIRVALIESTINKTTIATLIEKSKVNIEYNMTENTTIKNKDEYLMERAIELGNKGKCTALFNPWVGCVIATPNGQIIGEGYHYSAGYDHAERVAYLNAIELGNEDKLKGSYVYVTLEPCGHFGRTPPCDQLLIDLKVEKVFIAIQDPDPLVQGKGINNLINNGIKVELDFCNILATESLKGYLHQRITGLPYVIAKIACSIDGMYCFNDYTSQWITGENTRLHGRNLRKECQAIIVGTNTLIKDNPILTVRTPGYSGNQPICVVLDRYGNLEEKYPCLNVFSYKSTIIFKREECELRNVLKKLSTLGVIQCLVEGGAILQANFLKEHLINELYIYRANCIIGNKGINWANAINVPNLDMKPHFKLLKIEKIDHDILEQYKIVSPLLDTVTIIDKNNSSNQESSCIFDSVIDVLDYIKNGKPIIVMDNENRENEGDIMVPAQFITTEQMALMIRNTTGIICVSMPPDIAEQKKLPLMIDNNKDPLKTAFTVTCDAISTTTGVSASERVQTVRLLSDPTIMPESFKRPGHIFPLIAKNLMERQGHTEAGVTLCQLAGINPVMVLAELQKENGEMMRRNDCFKFAKDHDMKIITTEQILKYYIEPKCILMAETEIFLDIDDTKWYFSTYSSGDINFPHRVLRKGNCDIDDYIPVRIHSECFTGDVLGSSMCDCGDQLKEAKKIISTEKVGIVIFPGCHEGRGIGITNKIKAYDLMRRDKSIDTYNANCILGYKEDKRTFDDCVEILKKLILNKKIILLTNNPVKINILSDHFKIKRRSLDINCNKHNNNYLKIKNEKQLEIGFIKEPLHYMNNLPNPLIVKETGLKICIVKAVWHNTVINPFINEIISKLEVLGVEKNCITEHEVPGTYEILQAVKELLKTNKYNVIFCMGILIKGDTLHFESVLNSVNTGLTQLQLCNDTPIINNILSCFNNDQVIERTAVNSKLITSLAITTVYMAMKKYM